MSAIAWTGSSVVIVNMDGEGNLVYWWQNAHGGPLVWRDQTVATGHFVGAAIAWTGSAVVIVAADAAGNVNSWSLPDGASTWSQPEPVATGYSYPDIAATKKSAVITATQGSADSKVPFWWQAIGTTSWNLQTLPQGQGAGGLVTYYAPSIAWTGSSVIIAATGTDNLVHFWWQEDGAPATAWSPPQSLTPGRDTEVNYQFPSIAWTGTSVVICAVGTDGNIYYWWQRAGVPPPWGTPQQLPSGGQECFSPSIAWTGSSVIVAAACSDGLIHYWWQANATTQWNPPQQSQLALPSLRASEQTRFVAPSIAWTGSAVVISAVDQNTGNLCYWSQPADTSAPWNPPQILN
jgi:hypothetical protein